MKKLYVVTGLSLDDQKKIDSSIVSSTTSSNAIKKFMSSRRVYAYGDGHYYYQISARKLDIDFMMYYHALSEDLHSYRFREIPSCLIDYFLDIIYEELT